MKVHEVDFEEIVHQIEEALTPEASIAVAVIVPDGIKIISDCTASSMIQAIYAFTMTDTRVIPGYCDCDMCKRALVVIDEVRDLLRDHYEVRH